MKSSRTEITLWNRIWQAAVRDPEKPIISDFQQVWTWRSLLWRAQGYAEALRSFSVNSAETPIVPILVDRTGETVAAILGALISGRGFSPLSPQQPSSRLAHCFSSLNAQSVIFLGTVEERQKSEQAFPNLRHMIPVPQSIESGLPSQPMEPDSNQLFYVLFTSGSTGVPKGVVADYGNIENTLLWSIDMLDWYPMDVIGCATNFFFDISMFDVLTTLYFDIPLAIFSNPSDVTQVVAETATFRVTSIFAVPTFFSQLLRNGIINDSRLTGLRRIIAGGDFFPPAHVLRWMESLPAVDIFNVWGPTETSIVNTMHKIGHLDIQPLREGRPAPVGKAHSRMQFRLIDKSSKILYEPNQRGEICMLGACVTRGYIGDSEKTNQAYIELEGHRAFRTQDLGYVDDVGNLFIVGRIGSTVKVAGYRIDLGEVETAAVSLPGIHLACGFVFDVSESHQELWLALEPKEMNRALDIFLIKKNLRAILPAYMVPKRIIIIDMLPRNANAKIDRKAVKEIVSHKARDSEE
ncbi:AMP-binding protein [Leptospira noguchii]|uniref:AMP-binding protein n=1 Tax=Leptospira noguchii TaxID=28182 RepID=UPI001F05DBFA|nr:AMP-binding protein [Leptospira noguchii]MCH1913315.1 AMP-binding protein [Leptospira noguchii]MCH1915422.1 AMP-binding protein [Leptospira noguchii]UOG65271.1 AMP-binding protein [Leptospira noguchii]